MPAGTALLTQVGQKPRSLAELRASGRTVVGADLVEVAPGEPGADLDTVVAARLAWRLLGVLS